MATRSSSLNPTIGRSSLHTAWLFQAIASFPTAFVLGLNVFASLFSPYSLNVYMFITYTFNTLLASAILFLILVQWSLIHRNVLTPQLTYVVEMTKALTATVMWLWLLLDGIFYRERSYPGDRGKRIAIVSVSVILVVVVFYPTAVYAAYARKREGSESAAARGEATPLLAQGMGV